MTVYSPEHTAARAQELADPLAQSAAERDVIEAALLSFMSAIERVRPEARTELQRLLVEFSASPDDPYIVKRLGTLLRRARAPDH